MFQALSPPIGGLFALSALVGALPAPTFAQVAVPEITVTADRIEEPVGETGASVTIVHSEDLEKWGAANVADALRDVAGVEVVNAGGVGAVTEVSLRGAGSGETLVLIDGIRIGATTDPGEAVDFGNLALAGIDRIEVLRGPQSALYGSDAMGGVINIITRKGSKKVKRTVTVEGGSYGTITTRATMSGGDDAWTYSVGVDLLHSDGFPRYGYRISTPLTIGSGAPLPPLPSDDPDNKGGATARFSYKASDSLTIEFGGSLFGNGLRFDNPDAMVASDVFSKFNYSSTLIADGFVRAILDPSGSPLKNQLTIYGNSTTSNIWETEACYDNVTFESFNCRSGYVGDRYGGEYQGDVNLGPYGGLTFGARSETETASTNQLPDPNDGSFIPISARQVTNSTYAEYRTELFTGSI